MQTPLPQTLPAVPVNEILRPAQLDGILFQLSSNEIVIISGPQNIGKTTLLAQFFRQHANECICLFLRGASAWSYDLEMVTEDVLSQAENLAGPHLKFTNIELETPTAKLKRAYTVLHKTAIAANKQIYFILDGLDDIPERDSSAAEAIFNLIPIGLPHFRGILTGTRAISLVRKRAIAQFGEYTVIAFTEHETQQYLRDLVPDEASISKLHKISKGIPGYHASIRRIWNTHKVLPSDLPATFEKLLEIEWRDIRGEPLAETLIAILCFDRRKHTAATLARVAGLSEEEIDRFLKVVSFVVNRNGVLEFAEDLYRPLAEKRLIHLRKKTLDALIADFFRDANSKDSVTYLPALLADADRYDDLVAYLNDDYIVLALHNNYAARFVQERATIGLRAAAIKQKSEDALRFGLQGSNLDELYSDDQWASRIDAFMGVGEVETALRIARSCASIEDRVQALSAVVRHCRLNKLKVDEELISEITQECQQLDTAHLGARAFDIAADLVFVAPRIALDLVQDATDAGGDRKKMDFAVARLSLGAQAVMSEDASRDAVEKLRSRINNPMLRSFTGAARVVAHEQSPDRVIDEVDKMQTDAEKSYFLRLWLTENGRHVGRLKVAQYAVSFALGAKGITATPGFFLDVTRSLVGSTDCGKVFAVIEGQVEELEKIGPTVDCVRLKLKLVEVESGWAPKDALLRMERLIDSIGSIEDPSTQSAVVARGIRSLHRLRANFPEFEKQSLRDDLYRLLESCIQRTLEKTADHYQVTRDCVCTLATVDFAVAHAIAQRLNTEPRRDRAFADIVWRAAVNRRRGCDVRALAPCFNAIVSRGVQRNCLEALLRGLALGEKRDTPLYNLEAIGAFIAGVSDPESAAVLYGLFAVVLLRYGVAKSLAELEWIHREIEKYLAAAELSVDKLDCYYSLTFAFADVDRGRARQYLKTAEEMRAGIFVKTSSAERCLGLNIKTVLRAFSGLVKRRVYGDLEKSEIVSLINKLPGSPEQVRLLTELALRLFLSDALNECRDVVRENIEPLVRHEASKGTALSHRLIVIAAPALYCASQLSCMRTIGTLDDAHREAAIVAIIDFLCTQLVPGEPYEGDDFIGRNLNAQNIDEILTLLSDVSQDSTVCHFLHRIVCAVAAEGGRRFTRPQRAEIARRLSEVVNGKFPSKRFITHEGYKILGEAYVGSLTNAKLPEWMMLVERTRVLPNWSDRVYVMIQIADLFGGKYATEQRALFVEALELAQRIPVAYDRQERLLSIAEVVRPHDRELFKRALKSVVGPGTGGITDNRILDLRRKAIDLAYQHDAAYAESLVSALDDDPAKGDRAILERKLDVLKLGKAVAECKIQQEMGKSDRDEIAEAYWDALGRLNSGMLVASPLRALAGAFALMEGRSMYDAYAIVSFGVQNCVVKYEGTDEALTILKRIFRVCLSSARIVVQCLTGGDRRGIVTVVSGQGTIADNAGNLIVSKGRKPEAVEYIKHWLADYTGSLLYIVDPYFRPEDLEAVKIVREVLTDVQIVIVVSQREIEKKVDINRVRDAFREEWFGKLSSNDPGSVQVCIVGASGSGDHPIHDRWWIGEGRALRIGTSWNAIGGEKESEISMVDAPEAARLRADVERFALYMEARFNGAKMEYNRFSL